MDILNFIVEQAYVMIPVLLVVGKLLKDTTLIKDKYIPIVLLLIGVLATPLLLDGFTVENILQGILITGVSVYGNQVFKQLKKGEDK